MDVFNALAHGSKFCLKHVSFNRQSLAHRPKLLKGLMLDLKITLELTTLEFDSLSDLAVKVLGLQVEGSLHIQRIFPLLFQLLFEPILLSSGICEFLTKFNSLVSEHVTEGVELVFEIDNLLEKQFLISFENFSLAFDFCYNISLIFFIKVQIPKIDCLKFLEILQVHRTFCFGNDCWRIENEGAVLFILA